MQWWIQDFPEGVPHPKVGAPAYYWIHQCRILTSGTSRISLGRGLPPIIWEENWRKCHENERNLTERGNSFLGSSTDCLGNPW